MNPQPLLAQCTYLDIYQGMAQWSDMLDRNVTFLN